MMTEFLLSCTCLLVSALTCYVVTFLYNLCVFYSWKCPSADAHHALVPALWMEGMNVSVVAVIMTLNLNIVILWAYEFYFIVHGSRSRFTRSRLPGFARDMRVTHDDPFLTLTFCWKIKFQTTLSKKWPASCVVSRPRLRLVETCTSFSLLHLFYHYAQQ